MNLPWKKSYTIECPDGSLRIIYKDINEAFPLFVKGWKGNAAGKAGASAESLGVEGLKAEGTLAYSSEIQGMLFYITEMNQNVMMNFRSSYIAFVSDPCGSGDFFRRQVDSITSENQRITRLGIQVRTLIELVRNTPEKTMEILTLLKSIGGQMTGAASATAAALEINEARQLADDWVNNNVS